MAGKTHKIGADPEAEGGLPEMGVLIGELMKHVHRRTAGETLAILNDAGLTLPQLVCLHILEGCGVRTVSQIATALRLSPAATSHLVDRLVSGGWVGRIEDPVDRRQKRVTITAAGRRLVSRVQRERTREMTAAVAGMSPEVVRQFSKVLVKVIQELSSLPKDVS
jgi:MarR family transcriptional regulator, organic hydroperoxide resistance regulator